MRAPSCATSTGFASTSKATASATIDLLRRLTSTNEKACRAGSGECACAPATEPAFPGTPPQIAAAFEDLERYNRVHTPTTSLLRTFHRVLDHRVPGRTTCSPNSCAARTRPPATTRSAWPRT
ncbi:hypothetical protein ACIQ6K_35395 [Streptomyces sp. NPDC096354]|uniref:hypothetical protein n=1 Tax=Streptomyces sp. NPDC096354 TaxID=3366088 RepID=UPI0037F4DFBA